MLNDSSYTSSNMEGLSPFEYVLGPKVKIFPSLRSQAVKKFLATLKGP